KRGGLRRFRRKLDRSRRLLGLRSRLLRQSVTFDIGTSHPKRNCERADADWHEPAESQTVPPPTLCDRWQRCRLHERGGECLTARALRRVRFGGLEVAAAETAGHPRRECLGVKTGPFCCRRLANWRKRSP